MDEATRELQSMVEELYSRVRKLEKQVFGEPKKKCSICKVYDAEKNGLCWNCYERSLAVPPSPKGEGIPA